ncbi:hypothetical protein [Streptomyces sp. NPDC051561]|uniref:hypothetical protein n=1 Tax=Streptomyces sp. NPDC051561 TaxID=3365658 RepID=UPI0037B884E7
MSARKRPTEKPSFTERRPYGAELPLIITGIRPGLHVRFTRPPVADWLCRCGHHERATGRAAVIELTERVNVRHCPHAADETAPPTELGAEVAARQGVLSALLPDPHPHAAPAAGRRHAA